MNLIVHKSSYSTVCLIKIQAINNIIIRALQNANKGIFLMKN